MILLIDNYDSFTYNLSQMMGEAGADVRVVRNDAIRLSDLRTLAPAGIVVSPGPGRPEDAGISVEVIREMGPDTPILGVCLGHQAVAVAYGADVVRAPEVRHGKTSLIRHRSEGLYRGLPDPFEATRYHSLAVQGTSLPEELEVTAWTDDGVIMGIRHQVNPVEGVQFHPESCLTPHGADIIRAFLGRCGS